MTKLFYLAAFTMASAANASVMTVGGSHAQSCFEAADSRDLSRQAMDACDHALTQQPLTRQDRAATFVNRGIIHLGRTDLRRADADFDAALAIEPTQAEAWLNKAILHVQSGRSQMALSQAERALQLNTRRPALAYFVRALANEDGGNVAAAYRDFQRARALDPSWKDPAVELRRFRVRQL